MNWLRGVVVALILSPVAAACSSGEPAPQAGETEHVGVVSQAITTACSFDTIGLPCDPDGPAGAKLECEGVCAIGKDGYALCQAVVTGTLNGVVCGANNGIGAAACKHVCSGRACLVQDAALGTACRPDNNSSPCEGQCDGAGACTKLATPCTFGRVDQLCKFDTCNFTNAKTCVTNNLRSNTTCSDQDACSIGKCNSGVCVAGPTMGCDDGNACTDDTCDKVDGCSGKNNDANKCSDGNACLTGEHCSAGTCVTGTVPLDCDDGNACTADTCDPNTGCAHIAKSCSDNDACTVDSCDAGSGACSSVKLSCDDANPCTVDDCDVLTGCTHVGLNCDDANACTADSCSAGVCGHTDVDCDDNDPCTVESCSAANGCAHTAKNCDDNDACTADSCANGTCDHTTVSCNDNDDCTVDSCDAVNGCSHVAISGCGGNGGNAGAGAGGEGGVGSDIGGTDAGGAAGSPAEAGAGPTAGTSSGGTGGGASGGSDTAGTTATAGTAMTAGTTSGGSAATAGSNATGGNTQTGGTTPEGGDDTGTAGSSTNHVVDDGGCSCRTAGTPERGATGWFALALLGLAAARRRKAA